MHADSDYADVLASIVNLIHDAIGHTSKGEAISANVRQITFLPLSNPLRVPDDEGDMLDDELHGERGIMLDQLAQIVNR